MAYRTLEINIVTAMDVTVTAEVFDVKSNKMIASIVEGGKNASTMKFRISEEDFSEFEVRVMLVSEKHRRSWPSCFSPITCDGRYVGEVWFPLKQLFDVWESDFLTSYLSCAVGRSNSKSSLSSTVYRFITSEEFLIDINDFGKSARKFLWGSKKSRKRKGEFKLSYKFSEIINPTPQVIYDDSD